MMTTRRRKTRGQALTEMALLLPVLGLLMLGATDLGRAYYLNIEISGAARSGMRQGVINGSTDIGNSTRSEPNSAIANNTTVWGDTGPTGANDCDPTQPTHKCGDALGCPKDVFNANPSRLVCFAVRTCTVASGGTMTCPVNVWQQRPAQGSDSTNTLQVLDVRVVYKFVPATPWITNFTSDGKAFYLTVDEYGLELY
jgi:Flp pilus assembly protein TadG